MLCDKKEVRAPDEIQIGGKFVKSESDEGSNEDGKLVYEGPFASLSLRLKRISLSSAIVSIIAIPSIIVSQSMTGDAPILGQLAVGGTAIFAATGSTFMLSYCFSPYVHTLEWVKIAAQSSSVGSNGLNVATEDGSIQYEKRIKVVTRDFFTRTVETVFDPVCDVETDVKGTYRPFCNFKVANKPFYVHPELIHDEEVRKMLLDETMELEPSKGCDGKGKGKDDDWY